MRSFIAAPLMLGLLACKPDAARSSDPPAPSSSARASTSAAPVSAPYDTSCRVDDDCVPAPGCCPLPCTSLVVHRKELPRIQASLLQCDRTMPCLSAGGCRTHAYLCNGNRCALVYAGEPGFRERN